MNVLIVSLVVGSLVWGSVATFVPTIHPIVAIVLAALIGAGSGYVAFRVEQVLIRIRNARVTATARRIAEQINQRRGTK